MNSSIFLRLAMGKDKKEILDLSSKRIQIQKPDDIIKDTLYIRIFKYVRKSDL